MRGIFNCAVILFVGITLALCVISTDIVYADEQMDYESVSHTITTDVCEYDIEDNELEMPDVNYSVTNNGAPIVVAKQPANYLTSINEVGTALRNKMVDRKSKVEIDYRIPSSKTSDNNWFSALCNNIVKQALIHTGVPDEGDYLKFNLKSYNAQTTYYKHNGYCYLNMTFIFDYYTTASQEAKVDTAVKSLKNKLDLEECSDYETLNSLYRYICDYVDYNYGSSSLKYTAYNALINKSAVCQGYASLLYRLALEYDIDTRVITGTGKNSAHAWNIVKMGNVYYNLDSTWDAGNSTLKYFLRDSNSFSNHTCDSEYKTSSFKSKYKISSYPYPCSKHKWKSEYTTDKKATYSANGSKSIHCSVCNAKKSGSVKTIPKKVCKLAAPSTIKTSLTSYYGKTAGYDDIKIKWSKVSGASGYYVRYKRQGTDKWTNKYVSKTYTYIKDLYDGAKYDIRVYPYVKENDIVYKSPNYKSASSVRTLKKVPITKMLRSSGSYIKIKWSDISGESGYQVYRATSKNGKYSKIITVKSKDKKSYTIKLSAKKGKTYWYKIRSYKSLGDGYYVYGPWSEKNKYVR